MILNVTLLQYTSTRPPPPTLTHKHTHTLDHTHGYCVLLKQQQQQQNKPGIWLLSQMAYYARCQINIIVNDSIC